MQGIRQWKVWGLPNGLLFIVLSVDLLALAIVGVGARNLMVDPGLISTKALFTVAVLATAGAGHAEFAYALERFRSRVVYEEGGASLNMQGVWTFAAALLVHPAIASLVVVALHVHSRVRPSAGHTRSIFKEVFNISTVVLAMHAAASVASYVSPSDADRWRSGVGILAIAVAMAAYALVNMCLVVGAVLLSGGRAFRDLRDLASEIWIEMSNLCLGALIAMLYPGGPWLIPFAIPPLLLLHRALLVNQLQRAATTDGKTGLLTAGAWHERASAQLGGAPDNRVGVLILDLDRFKRINDQYGHLAGDRVLQAVANVLRDQVRGDDIVGRFGGEEFVMLLPQVGTEHVDNLARGTYGELLAVAERIRRTISGLVVEIPTPDGSLSITGISASFGGSVYPNDGRELINLIATADSALFTAKHAGRNRIRLGRQVPATIDISDPPDAHADRPAGS